MSNSEEKSFMEEDTFNYYVFFLDNLFQLTDKDNPGKSWKDEKGIEHYCSFDIIYEDFINSCGMVVRWPQISSDQRNHLKNLYSLVDSYNYQKKVNGKWVDMTDQEIRLDPKWHEIRKYATKIYLELKKNK